MTISLPLLISSASQYLVSWTDILMLGTLTNATEVGYYQTAFLYSVILLLFIQSINSIFPSVAAGLYETNEIDELERIYSVTTKWGIYLTAIAEFVVISFPDALLSLFGDEFSAATTTLSILVVGRILRTFSGSSSYVLSMSKYERFEAINTLLFGIINVVLNFYLIQKFGINGAAIATSISLVGMNISRLIQVQHLIGIHPFHTGYIKGILLLLVMGICIHFVGNVAQNLQIAVVTGACGLVFFMIFMYLLGFDEEDKRLLNVV